MLPPAIFAPAQFRAANAVTFVVNGALGGFAFVFIPALEIIAGYSPVVAGSALVPVTVVTLLLSGASGRLAQRIGPRPPLVAGCLLCTVASMLAVRIGPHAGYWTAVLPVAVLFGLGLAALLPPLTASAMNSAPDSLAGLASGVNNAVARVAGLLWIAALPPAGRPALEHIVSERDPNNYLLPHRETRTTSGKLPEPSTPVAGTCRSATSYAAGRSRESDYQIKWRHEDHDRNRGITALLRSARCRRTRRDDHHRARQPSSRGDRPRPSPDRRRPARGARRRASARRGIRPGYSRSRRLG